MNPRVLPFLRVAPGAYCVALTGDVASQARFDTERSLCTNGDAEHCTSLGLLYEATAGFPRHLALAAELYRLGCDGDDGRACGRLGTAYAHGRGVAKAPKRAEHFLGRGCALGDGESCGLLAARLTSTGDARRARDLYRRACDLGALEACPP